MSSFELEYDTNLLIKAIGNIRNAQNSVDSLNSKVNLLTSNIPPFFENTSTLNSIKESSRSITKDVNDLLSLLVTTSSKISLVDKTLKDRLDKLQVAKYGIEKFKVEQSKKSIYDSIFLDGSTETGRPYGGDQGDFISKGNLFYPNYSSYAKLVRKYYPQKTYKEIFDILQDMEVNGCAYITLGHAIVNSYNGNNKQFKEDWGFDLYSDQIPNVNMVAADLILKRSTKEGIIEGLTTKDEIEILENPSINPTKVRCRRINQDFNTLKKMLDKGYICELHASDYTFTNGDVYKDATHSMTITGLKENGNLIVSTWGEQREIDVNSLDENYKLNYFSEEY